MVYLKSSKERRLIKSLDRANRQKARQLKKREIEKMEFKILKKAKVKNPSSGLIYFMYVLENKETKEIIHVGELSLRKYKIVE
jgi:hypothetical protein